MPPALSAIQPELNTTPTPPTHHMNTDSRAGKCTRPVSPTPAAPSRTNKENTSSAPKDTTLIATTAINVNKWPNLEWPAQQTPTPNQWQYLQSDSSATAEISVNGVRTLDSGFKITATPAGGFPIPQLGQSTWQNISQILKERWPQKEGAKVWVRTYRAKYEGNAQNTVAKLKDAITKIVDESDAESLIVRIPPEAIKRLLRLWVCSSADISCFFVPFEQPLPTYAFTLENFSFLDSESTNEEIAEIVKDTIRSNPDIMQFIHNNIPLPDAEAALHTIESYFDWTNLMCTFFYISEDYGYGTARQDAQFICIGCKLFDHPTDLCPFPKLPGWFGPSAPDNMDNSNTTLDNRTMSSHSKGASNSSHSHGGRGSSRGHTRGHTKRGRGKTN
ncbi:hypothetical protein EV424DRAFT_1546601 [Suillus variegatus]|nr:hypothetical protein EV424DRAFT_1546601 [Suillus variegatus]